MRILTILSLYISKNAYVSCRIHASKVISIFILYNDSVKKLNELYELCVLMVFYIFKKCHAF